MIVTVIQPHYDNHKSIFTGDPERVLNELLQTFGKYVRKEARNSLDRFLSDLSRQQAFVVQVDADQTPMSKHESNLSDDPELDPGHEIVGDMHGYFPHLESTFDAARFLVGGNEAPLDSIRRILWEEDGDVVKAAFRAYGIKDNDENRTALESVKSLQGLNKSEPAVSTAAEVHAALATGESTAEAVRRAVQAGKVMAVQLGGKHSKGSLVARDPQDRKNYLLKPGSGPQSPAAGARQDPSSQSQREAAFWAIAHHWGLGNSLPHCVMLIIDGKQYACMDLLGWDYKPMEKLRDKDPAEPARDLEPYRQKGLLHRWAVLDAVLGNPDRHAANIMADPKGDVKLIDHGSAFAGDAFDPAYDRNSFVPFYLRFHTPSNVNFNALNMESKLRYMTLAPAQTRDGLAEWLRGLHVEQLEVLLPSYGIDPHAAIQRLQKIKQAALEQSPDLAINRFWAGT